MMVPRQTSTMIHQRKPLIVFNSVSVLTSVRELVTGRAPEDDLAVSSDRSSHDRQPLK
jgi:hypothetical protein